jgi:hypothetical protein
MAASGTVASAERRSTCRCGSEFIVGSVYCHVCGVRRPEVGGSARRPLEIPGQAEMAAVGARLGLTTAATVAFLVGLLCGLAALTVGVFFSARTLLDWQAIQLWRIEWLLAAIAAFVVGLLLKK